MENTKRANKLKPEHEQAAAHGCREAYPFLRVDELDVRLEGSILSLADVRPADPCVWACECFLVDGS